MKFITKDDNRNFQKHLILISFDSFSEDNWEMARELRSFSRLIKNGVSSTMLRSVYPTLTYTVHSTIVTGVYPDRHGIIHNTPLQPFASYRDQDWFWYRKNIKVPAIYDAAKDRGMKTAGIFWPVSGGASIKYNMPAVAAVRQENQLIKTLKNGNPFFCAGLELKYVKFSKEVKNPYMDDFSTLCAVNTIKRKKPNLLLLHLIDLDNSKHRYGTDSNEVRDTILRMDKNLGKIIEAVEEAGILDDTVFLILGDHGQLNVRYRVHLNNILREAGLIYKENGELKWRAYIQSCGGSAYLHIKKGDEAAKKASVEALKKAMRDGGYGIESILGRGELDALHVDKSIEYMLEAREGYSFEEELSEETVIDLQKKGIKHATHGYSPNKDKYRCVFLASGKGIKKGYSMGGIEMVDIAPTMGKILGFDFKGCDGRILEEIFTS